MICIIIANIVLSTILHHRSTSHTCTHVAVRYYSTSELAPCWKKRRRSMLMYV